MFFGRKKPQPPKPAPPPSGCAAHPHDSADPADLRQPYEVPGLRKEDLEACPFDQFQKWFTDAKVAGIKEPNAMTLATAATDGTPSARIVLLKGMNPATGFAFYTNYASAKAAELDANPRAALVFYWDRLDRQVRIAGSIRRLSDETNDAYFARRPRNSQLGAWVSNQSDVIPSREVMEQEFARLRDAHQGHDVPRPEHWGGYAVLPDTVEFWQGQPSRLHDRLRYRRADQTWTVERLAP